MRIRDRDSLEDLTIRLRNVLGFAFAPTDDPRDPWHSMVAEALFLRVMITYWPRDYPRVDGKEYMYTLSGASIDATPWESTREIDLGEWMLEKLRRHDSPAWYIPTMEELRAEIEK